MRYQRRREERIITKTEMKEKIAEIREKYRCYKVADLAVKLFLHEVAEDDINYIMQGGEGVSIRPYDKSQAWLAKTMDRLAERIPANYAVAFRQDCACCLSGERQTLARRICRENPTVEARFEALSKERKIIGGNAWKENGDYFITFWYAKPTTGYTCACLKHVPCKPMNKLWCECCAGHIKHHFETALGVKASCTCITSVVSSCGEDACLFKLNII